MNKNVLFPKNTQYKNNFVDRAQTTTIPYTGGRHTTLHLPQPIMESKDIIKTRVYKRHCAFPLTIKTTLSKARVFRANTYPQDITTWNTNCLDYNSN